MKGRESDSDRAVVETQSLTRKFGPRIAVDRIDLAIYPGEVFGFLGPNGAGKSTLMRMLLGLMTPSSGTAHVLGYKLPDESGALRSRVGYMTQRFSLYEDLTILENLEFVAEIYDLGSESRHRRIDAVMDDYQLSERRDQRPSTLSGGWKQRLALAAATLHRPEILFLDEPTAGVDPASRRFFWQKLFELASEGTTVLVSTHYMDEAARCHRLCLMRDGRRAALGTPADLTGALKGRTFEVRAASPERAVEILRSRSEVLGLTQLGYRIQVLMKTAARQPEDLAAGWRMLLREAGVVDVSVTTSLPGLEDVFIALVREEELIGRQGS